MKNHMKTTVAMMALMALAAASLPTVSAGPVNVGVEGCAGNYACGGEQSSTNGDRIEQRAYAQGGDAECGNGALVWHNLVVGNGNSICTGGDGQVCQDASTGDAGTAIETFDGFGFALTYDASEGVPHVVLTFDAGIAEGKAGCDKDS